ncbi:MAG: hypothetical protein M3Z66_12025 [Chloroflexota bacterium]|nr:hypothetical protein [Chloroflexota bacterium]
MATERAYTPAPRPHRFPNTEHLDAAGDLPPSRESAPDADDRFAFRRAQPLAIGLATCRVPARVGARRPLEQE